jgi:hypothetical protein
MNDTITALEALGFTVPSTAYLIGIVIFGIVGYVAYRYGKKRSLPVTKFLRAVVILEGLGAVLSDLKGASTNFNDAKVLCLGRQRRFAKDANRGHKIL